jgi:hypothetical protein
MNREISTRAENIRYSMLSFAVPQTIHWGLEKHLEMMHWFGYDSAEFAPLVIATFGALRLNLQELSSLKEFEAGHVVFNPATLRQIILGEEDPVRPGEKLKRHHLALSGPSLSNTVLNKFSRANSDFRVVTYPHYKGKQLYGEYPRQILQTSPDPFDDRRTVEELIEFVEDPTNNVEGVLWDTTHAWGKDLSGNKPLVGQNGELEFKNIQLLAEKRVLKGMHIQVARTVQESNTPTPYDSNELIKMTKQPKAQDSRVGELIQLVKSIDPSIPLVPEIHLYNLVEAGLVEAPSLFHVNWSNVRSVHKDIIDYMREI